MPDTHTRTALLFILVAFNGAGCSKKLYGTDTGSGGSHGVGGASSSSTGVVTKGAGGAGGASSVSSASSGGAGGGSGGSSGSGGEGGGVVEDVCPDVAHWLTRYGDSLDQVGFGVGADEAGNGVIAGAFQGSVDFGGGALIAPGGGSGVYVAKLSPNGVHRWSHAYAGGYDFVQGGAFPFATVAVAPSGDVLLGGVFVGTVDFGAGPVTSVSAIGDGFIVAFDSAGHARWSTQYSDPPPDPNNPVPIRPQVIESLAFDPAGNALALGYRYVGSFGAMFLVKLDPAGNVLWTKNVSASGTLEATVRADAAGNVVVAGLAYAPIDFGLGPIPTSPSFPTLFRGKLDPGGAQLWSKGVLTTGFALHAGNGLGVDPAGNVFIAGAGTSIGFDAGCGAPPLAWEVKLLQFDGTSGDCRWQWGFPGTGAALAVDAAGRAILASDAADTLIRCPDSGAGLPGAPATRPSRRPA